MCEIWQLFQTFNMDTIEYYCRDKDINRVKIHSSDLEIDQSFFYVSLVHHADVNVSRQ